VFGSNRGVGSNLWRCSCVLLRSNCTAGQRVGREATLCRWEALAPTHTSDHNLSTLHVRCFPLFHAKSKAMQINLDTKGVPTYHWDPLVNSAHAHTPAHFAPVAAPLQHQQAVPFSFITRSTLCACLWGEKRGQNFGCVCPSLPPCAPYAPHLNTN